MLPLNFGAPTGNPVYTKQELNSFLPNPNVTGLLGPALNFNAPNNAINQQYSLPSYQPTLWEGPSDMYKIGSIFAQSGNPLFNFMGTDMMRKNPLVNWTITKN